MNSTPVLATLPLEATWETVGKLFVCFVFCLEIGSLRSPGYLENLYVDQAGLNLQGKEYKNLVDSRLKDK